MYHLSGLLVHNDDVLNSIRSRGEGRSHGSPGMWLNADSVCIHVEGAIMKQRRMDRRNTTPVPSGQVTASAKNMPSDFSITLLHHSVRALAFESVEALTQ